MQLAVYYFRLQYPDLAAGSAYKALLLSDAISDESDEYHEQACEPLDEWLEKRSGHAANEALQAGDESHFDRNNAHKALISTV